MRICERSFGVTGARHGHVVGIHNKFDSSVKFGPYGARPRATRFSRQAQAFVDGDLCSFLRVMFRRRIRAHGLHCNLSSRGLSAIFYGSLVRGIFTSDGRLPVNCRCG